MTLVIEIAAGIVLGVILLYCLPVLLALAIIGIAMALVIAIVATSVWILVAVVPALIVVGIGWFLAELWFREQDRRQ
jgi:hypothetical protein